VVVAVVAMPPSFSSASSVAAAAPVATETKSGQNAQDILAMIRARQNK